MQLQLLWTGPWKLKMRTRNRRADQSTCIAAVFRWTILGQDQLGNTVHCYCTNTHSFVRIKLPEIIVQTWINIHGRNFETDEVYTAGNNAPLHLQRASKTKSALRAHRTFRSPSKLGPRGTLSHSQAIQPPSQAAQSDRTSINFFS